MNGARGRLSLFRARQPDESALIAEILREETVGGVLLLVASSAALAWANWPGTNSYQAFLNTTFGPESLHLHLNVAEWAGDGLLAIFFFIAGLEVKREFIEGDLSTPSRAALPILAAVGGMAVPAVLFVLVNLDTGSHAWRGWAIPAATDIAFALAVLAIISTHLPAGLRTFLLTLAVVDDLLAIAVIAVFYTSDLKPLPLLLAALPIAAFGVLTQRRIRAWWLLLPLAAAAWTLVHASGVHATVAGVLLAFTIPVRGPDDVEGTDSNASLAESFEHRLRPISAGLAVPVFAFCAAGVDMGGWTGLRSSLTDRITLGIVIALVIGKSVGIFGTTFLVARLTKASLHEDLAWTDIAGLSLLGGIGFTVSLLIGELAYGATSPRNDHAKIGVLAGSILAAALAAIVLRRRNRRYRHTAT